MSRQPRRGARLAQLPLVSVNICWTPIPTKKRLVKNAKELRKTASEAVEAATKARDLFRKIRTELFKISARMDTVQKELTNSDASYGSSLEAIKKATRGLFRLTGSVNNFADWWINMETALQVIEVQAQPGAGEVRIRHLLRRWEEVYRDYKDYKTKICRTHDRFP